MRVVDASAEEQRGRDAQRDRESGGTEEEAKKTWLRNLVCVLTWDKEAGRPEKRLRQ